ncbi:MAG: HlyD family efflux transporter periplasmic adaptor subunit [Planctomycetes bacterium]|nr:HlyD family efflux transporter periplasmic adaptor subunit [Planctomycetota bacterium]
MRHGRLSLHIVPILVWLAALACVVQLFSLQSRRFEVLGIAQGRMRQVQATVTGRLVDVKVELFEEVQAGQVLAVLDTLTETEHLQPEIAAKKAVYEAEIQRLEADLNSAHDLFTLQAAQRQTELSDRYLQLSTEVQKAHTVVLELKAVQEPDRIKLAEMELKVKSFMVQNLIEQDNAAVYNYKMLQLQYDALAKKIEENDKLLAKSEEDLRKAEDQREAFAKQQPPDASLDRTLEPIRRAIVVQQKRIAELSVEREPVILRVPFAGLVSEIVHRAGEVILPGDAVLTISENKPREIAAWVSESQANVIQKDMRVRLVKNSEPPQIANSQVVYLGPNVELVPQRLWDSPDTPKWGRRMLIGIHADMKLLPGEVVGIRQL